MGWRDAYEVHPAADVLPLLPPDELKELGSDIKKNGLRQKVVVAPVGGTSYILDGRNRLDALEAVGAEVLGEDGKLDLSKRGPKKAESMSATQWGRGVQYVRPKDIGALIVSLNIQRRHLPAGKRAELALKVLEVAAETGANASVSRGGRGRKGKARKVAELAGVSKDTARRAIDRPRGRRSRYTSPVAHPHHRRRGR